MAAIAVAPFLLTDVTLLVGTDNYEAHVSTVSFEPSSSVVNWNGLTPASSFSFGTNPVWVCNLTYAQDWTTPNSLSAYLFAQAGTEKAVEFVPVNGGATIEATLIIQPGAIGGDVNAVATASVSLGVKGKPTVTPGV